MPLRTIHDGYRFEYSSMQAREAGLLTMIVGTDGVDTLQGTDGDDSLDGLGGDDYMYGGGGNDALYGGEGDDWLVGNGGSNLLDGGAGDDSIASGTGNADTIDGGSGIDILWFDHAELAIGISFALAEAGVGTVVLPDGTQISGVERIWFWGSTTAPDTISGAARNDYIFGGGGDDILAGLGSGDYLRGDDGADTLNGGPGPDRLDGGRGIDSMRGGSGDDTYAVTAGDLIFESPGAGIDTVASKGDWTLGATFEHLTLIGIAAITGRGNALPNRISGSHANNVLFGAGGDDTIGGGNGNDTMWGGAGEDRFTFDRHAYTTSVDRLPDFGGDMIVLGTKQFPGLSAGQPLAPESFRAESGVLGAVDVDDRILYDTADGSLYYDADGSGHTAAVRFAVLGIPTARPPLSADDFIIVA